VSEGFFSRWSQRKVQVREGLPVVAEPAVAPAAAAVVVAEVPPAASQLPAEAAPRQPEPPPLTLDDVAALTTTSDYAPFVARTTAPEVKNAALKKLFSDPQFNVMDGLDTYIDDYNKPDPLPAGMLRQMVQSQLLGLFADEDKPPQPQHAPPEPLPPPATHEDADLQLQPHDAAGAAEPAAPGPGAGEDAAAVGPGQH
jgi:Protein of unknown function (DUF3306)